MNHLRESKYKPIEWFTEPKSDLLFIQRLLESLKESYNTNGFKEKEEKTGKQLKLFQNNV